jgi:ATP-dependent helicase HrpB
MNASGLPIDEVLPALRAALTAHRSAVLHAPPGAGKSTVVPLALLDEAWARGKRLVMLEPRRLAARAVARRMAQTLDDKVGATVGYRMRLDTRVSRATRIEVVTEGVLTRMLQDDPSLEGVALVIFDEFHERSLQADLGLALTLDARDALAPELRLLVMSATLDVEPVARILGDAAIVTAEGRAFPVETRYAGQGAPLLPGRPTRPDAHTFGRGKAPARGPLGGGTARTPWRGGAAGACEQVVTQTVRRALRETEGDLLVFLPGAAEIRRVQSQLETPAIDDDANTPDAGAQDAGARDRARDAIALDAARDARDAAARDAGAATARDARDAAARVVVARSIRIVPLFGDLDAAAQDAALVPSPAGERKVVLATNIAETSLTIAGVRVVVDSGLARRSLFDPATGMSRLETQRISRASAEQRQGRAGRTAPGVCYRAWSEAAHRSLAPTTPPEIMSADLAPLALELASWGVTDPAALRWLDPPPAAMLASARDLLRRLGALDAAGRITQQGREMARVAVHPRLARMLLAGRELGCVRVAARLAALLSERDLLRGGSAARDADHADVRKRLALLSGERRGERGALQRVRRFARELERQFGNGVDDHDSEPLTGVLLAFAYPDRIGRRRAGGAARYTLANGRGAVLAEDQSLAREEYIVAVDLDDRDRDARILLAVPLARADIETHFAADLERGESVEWSSRDEAVIARRTLRLGALVIDEKPLPQVPQEAARDAMLAGVRELGLDALPWTREAHDLRARVEFVRALGLEETTDWPAMDDTALAASLERWLLPWLDGRTRREHLARVPLVDALNALLGWERQRRLDELAPTRLEVPSGSRIRIDYRDDNAPVAAVRLQEVFGLDESPRIGGGRVPVTFKLLSPAERPVQVTRDLASFWRGTYADVRKDLRGRYPTHYWPENPLEAQATRGVRRRR